MPCQIQGSVYVPLKELLNEREEEVNRALIKNIGLEDALEQPNTMKTEQKCEVQKLDDLYQQKAQEAEKEDEKCARELEFLEKHP